MTLRHRPGAPRAAALALALGLAAAGCAAPEPVTTLEPAQSFDGRFEGRIEVSGAAGSLDPRDCAVPPRIALDVRDNRFTYVLAPPILASAPGLARTITSTYQAQISGDGAIEGFSGDTNTVMKGRVADGRMSGEIFGLLCYYRFTLTRA